MEVRQSETGTAGIAVRDWVVLVAKSRKVVARPPIGSSPPDKRLVGPAMQRFALGFNIAERRTWREHQIPIDESRTTPAANAM